MIKKAILLGILLGTSIAIPILDTNQTLWRISACSCFFSSMGLIASHPQEIKTYGPFTLVLSALLGLASSSSISIPAQALVAYIPGLTLIFALSTVYIFPKAHNIVNRLEFDLISTEGIISRFMAARNTSRDRGSPIPITENIKGRAQGLTGPYDAVATILYNRALKISRSAAINELAHENISGCEKSYIDAIGMLEAILKRHDNSTSQQRQPSNPRDEKEAKEGGCDFASGGLNIEDRQMILKAISMIRIRLSVVRKRMALVDKPRSLPLSSSRSSSVTHNSNDGTLPTSSNFLFYEVINSISNDLKFHSERYEYASGMPDQIQTLLLGQSSGNTSWREQLISAVQTWSLFQRKALPINSQRLQWSCKCGYRSYDDFVEHEPGATIRFANELFEADYISHAQISGSTNTPLSSFITYIYNFFVGTKQRLARFHSPSLPTFSTVGRTFDLCPEDLVDHIIPDKLPPTIDEYDFMPPPPLKKCPPIGASHMMHLFTSCTEQPLNASLYLRHIPKRTDQALSFRADLIDGQTGYVLHFVEKQNNSLAVTVMFIVSLIVGLVFGVWWTVRKQDIQGAFGVASYVTSVITLAVMAWQMWSS
ncbi:hypothetical protein EG329_002209 [Mollisiaceae sp. DMI_Dod_QoI]|nr:hypothetical protein EG329_002209 [Helotiales sp. DMI_Dod_QoI]